MCVCVCVRGDRMTYPIFELVNRCVKSCNFHLLSANLPIYSQLKILKFSVFTVAKYSNRLLVNSQSDGGLREGGLAKTEGVGFVKNFSHLQIGLASNRKSA